MTLCSTLDCPCTVGFILPNDDIRLVRQCVSNMVHLDVDLHIPVDAYSQINKNSTDLNWKYALISCLLFAINN